MAKRQLKGRRGPPRKANSVIKRKCQFKKCRRGVDVKNISNKLTLAKSQVDAASCRNISERCQAVKFCCEDHMKACKKNKAAAKPRGGRACLDIAQIQCLFSVLLEDGCAWAAALTMTQLFMGDRADAARQCQWSWLENLAPESLKQPTMRIPRVNGKTIAREVALFPPFARLLWKWCQVSPLQAKNGSQWPCGHKPSGDDLLFPGYSSDGQKRQWDKAISERAYLARLHRAASVIQKARRQAEESQEQHAFCDFDLSKLGTHSFKKTTVTLLSEAHVAYSVISSICGTSVKVLQSTYDLATPSRQSSAWRVAFKDLADTLDAGGKAAALSHCGGCGKKQGNDKHRFCTDCGMEL
ncbi:unnamed protein product [Effrenium voratum]|uniref:Uncharacterized protein n=1 Tax=Effrenium voratum TaxID=2562239 RepID=A0AA36I4P5_9DINO|nr:unnamed protein product [Effrenium voratum]